MNFELWLASIGRSPKTTKNYSADITVSLFSRAEGAREAYNMGLNDGPAAGRTISHLHVHLIPR